MMSTDSERIEKLERLAAAMQRESLGPKLTCAETLPVTASQMDAVRKLLQSWITLEGTEGGEFDPMDYLAASRGWNPLEVNEKMLVHIGDKAYEIRRAK